MVELPRVIALGRPSHESSVTPAHGQEDGATPEAPAASRFVPSGTVRRSGRGSVPWSEPAHASLPDPGAATPEQRRSASRAGAALAAGATWESLPPSDIDALVRVRPAVVLATDAPWPVRHQASMMLLVRDRMEILNGTRADITVEVEQEAARAELATLGRRLERVSETVAAWFALQARVAELSGPWRAWLVSYDPQTGVAVMAVTNSAGVAADSVITGHVVTEGPTVRYQFARAVDHIVADARRADANSPFVTVAAISDRVGEDPFHGAMGDRWRGTCDCARCARGRRSAVE
jgi:hypothetical protein